MSGPGNPSAFPGQQCETLDGSWNQTYDPGMTLRDWFAGKALSGILAACNYDRNPHGYSGDAAHDAYAIADAMLAARGQS